MNDDCLLIILSFLNINDIKNCSLINKRFYKLAINDLIWKILFENKFNKSNDNKNYYYKYKKYHELFNFLKSDVFTYNINSNYYSNQMVPLISGIKDLSSTLWVSIIHDIDYIWQKNQLKYIPPEIDLLVNLKKLELCYIGLLYIPKEIGNLLKLQRLDLSNNRIYLLPKEIGNLTKLNKLYLSTNKLRSIPKEICQLKELDTLYLHNNKIQSIPREIGNLLNLCDLTINNNKIQTIPKEIGKLVNLHTLNLNNNKIKILPNEIENLIGLRHIHIHDNKLYTLPPELGKLPNIRSVHIDWKIYRHRYINIYNHGPTYTKILTICYINKILCQ